MVNQLANWWGRLKELPLGKEAFSRALGAIIPYTGSIKPKIIEVKPGYAKVALKDRRSVRNHLNSVHALALANLGELSTGLALHFGMPKNGRAILTKLEVEYLKKARGSITAEASVEGVFANKSDTYKLVAELNNEKNEVVAKVMAHWLVELKPNPVKEG